MILSSFIKDELFSSIILIIFIGLIYVISVLVPKISSEEPHKRFPIRQLFSAIIIASILGILLTIIYVFVKFKWTFNSNGNVEASFVFNPYNFIVLEILFAFGIITCIILFKYKTNLSWSDLGFCSTELKLWTITRFIVISVIIIILSDSLFFNTVKFVIGFLKMNTTEINKMLFFKNLYSNSIFNIFYYLWPIIIVPLYEETFYRGVIFSSLRETLGLKTGLILQAIIFALMHKNIIMLLPLFISGMIFGYIYYKSKSLFPSIIVHSLANILTIIHPSSVVNG